MACSDYGEDYWQAWNSEAFRDAILCPYQDELTGPFFAMVVWGVLSTSLYIRTGSVLPPVILTAVTGGALFSTMASPLVALVTVVLMLVVALAPIVAINRLTGP